jgi:WhiB family redox-sensing transcriptional regulator
MRVGESRMTREPPMPHGFAHDGTESMDWRMLAASLDEDSELFFPTGTTPSAKMQAALAKEVCTQCIVRDECLDWAMDTRQDHGVWGGLDEFERRSLLRRAQHRKPADWVGRVPSREPLDRPLNDAMARVRT